MFNITKSEYYADFVVFPILMLLAAIGGLDWRTLLLVPLGFAAWTFGEYWIHRAVFHNPKLYRRDHWKHHLRPAAFVGVHPAYTSAGGFALLMGLWATFGGPVGGALFNGLTLGYFAYIWTHDAVHHGTARVGGAWFAHRAACHDLHHDSGKEVNFGVVTGFWDGLYGTYLDPKGGASEPVKRVLTL